MTQIRDSALKIPATLAAAASLLVTGCSQSAPSDRSASEHPEVIVVEHAKGTADLPNTTEGVAVLDEGGLSTPHEARTEDGVPGTPMVTPEPAKDTGFHSSCTLSTEKPFPSGHEADNNPTPAPGVTWYCPPKAPSEMNRYLRTIDATP